MPDNGVWLFDSNILLRISKWDDPHAGVVRRALDALTERRVRLCYTSQALGEFWNVSTRPVDRNGFGLSLAETDCIARAMESRFEFLPDSAEVHERWRALLVTYEVKGVQVHDARLAASMYVHGISSLLTINVRDFRCFRGIRAVHPADLG